MVRLGQHRPATVGQPLDDVGLPQRTGAIHPTPDDACDLFGELVGPAGRGEPDVANVVVEIEVGIVDPIRVVEFERHLDQPPTHGFEAAEQRVEAFVGGLIRIEVALRPFVDGETVHVAVGVGGLHVEETRVEAGQLLHTVQSRAHVTAKTPRTAPCRPSSVYVLADGVPERHHPVLSRTPSGVGPPM